MNILAIILALIPEGIKITQEIFAIIAALEAGHLAPPVQQAVAQALVPHLKSIS